MTKPWPADKVTRKPLADLLAHERNARTHSDAQVDQIAASMREFGWTNPVLVDEGGQIIAGHGRALAASRLGFTEAPVMVARGWTDAQKRAYLIADNKLTLNAGWDKEFLGDELADLAAAGFDIGLTGFDRKELAELTGDGGAVAVYAVPVSEVADRFWISVRGPLRDQADAIQKIRAVMAELKDVEVELGTTDMDF